eukprot:482684-Pleurochrysis_carterae.AAC.1
MGAVLFCECVSVDERAAAALLVPPLRFFTAATANARGMASKHWRGRGHSNSLTAGQNASKACIKLQLKTSAKLAANFN